MKDRIFRVQMRYRAADDWVDAPGYVESEIRARMLMSLGRQDYNGGMWRITKGEEVIHEDKAPQKVSLLKRIIPWL